MVRKPSKAAANFLDKAAEAHTDALNFYNSLMDMFLHLATEYRAYLLTFFALPVGFLAYVVQYVRDRIGVFFASPQKHDERVAEIQKEIKERSNAAQPMCTARPTYMNLSTRFPSYKSKCKRLSLSHLNNILSVDTEKMILRAEPYVTVGKVCKELLPRNLTLAVCLELFDATLGGLAMGVGMTTHSHKVGLYQECVTCYEILTGDGRLIRATKDGEHSDLWYTLPWSHGSLGLLVALEVKIIPCKPYIKLTYTPFAKQGGPEGYGEAMRSISTMTDTVSQPDFIEMTVFSKNKAVIMTGDFSDGPSCGEPLEMLKINHVGRWYKKWFFTHVETFLEKGKAYEYIPIEEYLLRHNRAIFWTVQDMIEWGNNFWFRLFCGWLMPPRVSLLKYSTTPAFREMTFTCQVFQDIVMPIAEMENAINKSEEELNIYPVLVYPCRIYNHKNGAPQGQIRAPRQEYMVPGTNYGMYMDLGVYGVPKLIKEKKFFNTPSHMRKMEEYTCKVGGAPFLYADTFFTEAEFEEMFDLTLYKEVRAKYNATGSFPSLFQKIRPEVDTVAVGERIQREGLKIGSTLIPPKQDVEWIDASYLKNM